MRASLPRAPGVARPSARAPRFPARAVGHPPSSSLPLLFNRAASPPPCRHHHHHRPARVTVAKAHGCASIGGGGTGGSGGGGGFGKGGGDDNDDGNDAPDPRRRPPCLLSAALAALAAQALASPGEALAAWGGRRQEEEEQLGPSWWEELVGGGDSSSRNSGRGGGGGKNGGSGSGLGSAATEAVVLGVLALLLGGEGDGDERSSSNSSKAKKKASSSSAAAAANSSSKRDPSSLLGTPAAKAALLSGMLGAAAGAALKWAGRAVLTALGVAFLSVQALAFAGVVEVDWRAARERALRALVGGSDRATTGERRAGRRRRRQGEEPSSPSLALSVSDGARTAVEAIGRVSLFCFVLLGWRKRASLEGASSSPAAASRAHPPLPPPPLSPRPPPPKSRRECPTWPRSAPALGPRCSGCERFRGGRKRGPLKKKEPLESTSAARAACKTIAPAPIRTAHNPHAARSPHHTTKRPSTHTERLLSKPKVSPPNAFPAAPKERGLNARPCRRGLAASRPACAAGRQSGALPHRPAARVGAGGAGLARAGGEGRRERDSPRHPFSLCAALKARAALPAPYRACLDTGARVRVVRSPQCQGARA